MSRRLRRLGKRVLLRVPYVGRALHERDQLLRERDQLQRKHDQLLREHDRLLREHDQLQRERDQLQLVGAPSELDRSLYAFPLKNKPRIAYHGNLYSYLATFANDARFRILEIGSREVVSASIWKYFVPNCDYVGFDVLPGKNVDVVGDAHKLSEHFEPESFDVVIALAVFEHLAMPWVVAEEIEKVLKPGGLVLIETHFSFNEHESPWHFFQFNKNGLESLFNPGLGFEVIDSGMDTPMVGRFAFDAAEYLRGRPIAELFCHSSIIARKVARPPSAIGTDPWRASYAEFIQASMYPSNTGLSAADTGPDEQ